jgi:hypothetical protein
VDLTTAIQVIDLFDLICVQCNSFYDDSPCGMCLQDFMFIVNVWERKTSDMNISIKVESLFVRSFFSALILVLFPCMYTEYYADMSSIGDTILCDRAARWLHGARRIPRQHAHPSYI